ncbi:MAG: hypothetical protein HY297_02610 [Thaumarchaeota archaeon]|nr:hypothetical protein [Nitrososphaerota archaeon]
MPPDARQGSTRVANRVKIVGIGDSTTAGTPGFRSPLEAPPKGEGDVRSQYAYWMARSHSEWDVLNKGVNGERSDQILARFGRDVLSEGPKFVVILAGVNDIFQGIPGERITANLSEMYDSSLQTRTVPVACSVLPYNFMGSREAGALSEINQWIVGQSRRLSIPYADTSTAVADTSDWRRLGSTPDGLHPDVEGYRKMAEKISEAIEAAGRIL